MKSAFGKKGWSWSRQDHLREIRWFEKLVKRAEEEVQANPEDDEAYSELCDTEAVLRFLRKQLVYIEERGAQ